MTITRRSVALIASGVLLIVLSAGAALFPVPYVREAPGPTRNTIGSFDGTPLITIRGHKTYPTSGHLDLLTVSVAGGPGNKLDLFQTLGGWLDKSIAVVPEETVYPKGTTGDQVERENAEEMSLSQVSATAAALTALHIAYQPAVLVQAIVKGSPADGVLKAGDAVTSVNGRTITTNDQVGTLIREGGVGATVRLGILRDDQKLTKTLTTVANPDAKTRPYVGINVQDSYRFPFDVEFGIDKVGGPSAGQMFALGIIDKLTPGSLTGGKYVAGTGTIDADGKVGAIGGIQQKMVAAHRKGADLFLAPASNCDDVKGAVPDGLHVVAVKTLDDSLAALKALRAGSTKGLPTCG